MTSKRKTSEVWTYFLVDQGTPVFAQCLLCDMRLKRGKENDRVSWSVSPLWNHLKRNHPEEHSRASDQRSAVERSTKQRKVEEAKKKEIYTLAVTPKLADFIQKNTKYLEDNPEQNELTKLLVEWLADGVLPYNLVENSRSVTIDCNFVCFILKILGVWGYYLQCMKL